MSKSKTITALLSLAATAMVAGCNPLADAIDIMRPMSDLCADDGQSCEQPPTPPPSRNG